MNDLKSGKYDIVNLIKIEIYLLFHKIIFRLKIQLKLKNGPKKQDKHWPKCLLIYSMKNMAIINNNCLYAYVTIKIMNIFKEDFEFF